MERKSRVNIYGIAYEKDKGFKIIKDKVKYCHTEGYFSTTLGEVKFYFINRIPENINYYTGCGRIVFVFLDEKLVRRFFNLMKEKLIKSVDFEINEKQAIKEKIVNSELCQEVEC
jgi:hypothetical protein